MIRRELSQGLEAADLLSPEPKSETARANRRNFAITTPHAGEHDTSVLVVNLIPSADSSWSMPAFGDSWRLFGVWLRSKKKRQESFANHELSNPDEENPISGSTQNPTISTITAATTSTIVHHPTGNGGAFVLCILIALTGILSGSAIIVLGLTRAFHDQDEDFRAAAVHVMEELNFQWDSYLRSARWMHGACHRLYDDDGDGDGGDDGRTIGNTTTTTKTKTKQLCTRQHFRELYQQLNLPPFTAVGLVQNVTHDEREAYESDTREWFNQSLPQFRYPGFWTPELPVQSSRPLPRPNATFPPRDFYFPVQYVEPVGGGFEVISGLDFYACCKKVVNLAFETGQPVMASRELFANNHLMTALLFLHPGDPPSAPRGSPDFSSEPRDLSFIIVPISPLLNVSLNRIHDGSTSTYMFLSKPLSEDVYLGGAHVRANKHDPRGFHVEIETDTKNLTQLRRSKPLHYHEENLMIGFRTLTVVVLADGGFLFRPLVYFACIGGSTIIVACIVLSLWMWSSWRRQVKWHLLQVEGEAEKAALLLEAANRTARHERELNDFIAHEVRNPLAAAISACSFVSTAIVEQGPEPHDGPNHHGEEWNDKASDQEPLIPNESTRRAAREDLSIVETSLHFINDLLRNMLDMQRAHANQLQINAAPVDVRQDVLKAVDALLYRRGGCVRVEVDCPPNLIVRSDRLRLKQIVLNLGRNALKFVGHQQTGNADDGSGRATSGFIRLGAGICPKTGFVRISVEDSGPGIPMEKRRKLFAKFQKSLDSLHQGTGIGLCLCQTLVELMGGEIWLDESYHSGIEGCPGSRFVLDLKVPPMTFVEEEEEEECEEVKTPSTTTTSSPEIDVKVQTTESENGLSLANSGTNGADPQLPAIVGNGENVSVENHEQLPEDLSVLFVDDDMVLRKLFTRVLRKVAPTSWRITEAVNGESALQFVEEAQQQQSSTTTPDQTRFDLIFVDMYMSSVEQQLLGTDTVRALRARGVGAIICGLSANDVERPFLEAGADAFMFKPFPTKPAVLRAELGRMLRDYDPIHGRLRSVTHAGTTDTVATTMTSSSATLESSSLSSAFN